MTNNKNNDEIKSTHPEAFEDIKVSDSVPNSYKELLEPVSYTHLTLPTK